MSEANEFAYEKIPYPSYLHSQTHPNRLAVMAMFYGMNPKDVKNCRVLELGCGNGSNLIAFAHGLPESEFVGIDLAKNHIRQGNFVAGEIGLENIEFICGDVLKLNRKELGEFDYIIAHGLYSWVPKVVRDAVLEVCREMLAKQGVAFISYNAMPGCHLRLMAGEMMKFHTQDISEPEEKVKQSLAFLNFLSEAKAGNEVYQKILTDELKLTIDREPDVIFHDDLSDENNPFYFHEVIANAETHELQFLSEINYFTDKNTNFPPKVREMLNKFDDDRVKGEQYFDFLKNTRFRQTLLCHQEIKLNKQSNPDVLRKLWITSDLQNQTDPPNFAPSKIMKFAGKNSAKIQIDHPLTKAALYLLGKSFPHSISFDELLNSAKELIKIEVSEQDEKILQEILMQIYGSKLVEFQTYESPFTTEISKTPTVSKLARWQAQNGNQVSTLNYSTVSIEDKLVRELMILFDGTRTREEVSQKIVNNMKFETDKAKKIFLQNFPSMFNENLKKMARMALLTD